MRSRAIIAGIFCFSLLFTLVVVLLNTLHQHTASVAQWGAYILIWVVPGYVATLFSGRRGMLNGLITGLIIGVASAFGILVALGDRVGLPFTRAEVFLAVTCTATLLSALGALLGRLVLRRR